MASQTEGKPEWFLPGVTDQMLSEIIVGKSWKLASPHYALKSESDEIVMPWFTMHYCLCLKPKSIVLRATPRSSSTYFNQEPDGKLWAVLTNQFIFIPGHL